MIGDGYTLDVSDFTDEEIDAAREQFEADAARADEEARDLWARDREA